MIDIIPFNGWKNNIRLSNGTTELIATLDVGPRILSYSMKGRGSPLNVYSDQMGGAGEDVWRNRGGHRLWIAPEDRERTYFPDNAPVAWERLGALCVRLTPPPETPCGIQKQIEIELAPTGTQVTLTHRIICLESADAQPMTLAPWALTVMKAGGVAIMPQPPRGEHPRDLLPNRTWVLWPYSDLGDPRWSFGPEFVMLRHDSARGPTKLGMALETGVCGYLHDGVLFIKRFPFDPGAVYPDKGCNFEAFTNTRMVEIESLGPLVTLQPGQMTEHIERWELREAPAEATGNMSALRDWLLGV